jgi:hypothetical protein
LNAYANQCGDKYRLREPMRFNTRIADATFDEDHHLWELTTADGDELTCRFLIGSPARLARSRLSAPLPPHRQSGHASGTSD